MFIREDLISEIKKFYESERFEFVEISKDEYRDNIIVFQLDNCKIAFSYRNKNKYSIFEANKDLFGRTYYLRRGIQFMMLTYKENVTTLTINLIFDKMKEIKFKGRAFDFDKEMIIATLENN